MCGLLVFSSWAFGQKDPGVRGGIHNTGGGLQQQGIPIPHPSGISPNPTTGATINDNELASFLEGILRAGQLESTCDTCADVTDGSPVIGLGELDYYHGAEAVRRTLDLRDAMQRVFDKYPDQIELATSAHDVERTEGEKKIAAILTAEGGHQIDDDLAVLRMYRRIGILSMTLTHMRNNHWADSSTDASNTTV